MTAVGTCPRCDGPLETVEFARDTKFAVWCPTCNEIWDPVDQQPQPQPEPQLDKSQIVWPQQIKNTILRRRTEQAELDRIHRQAVRDTIRQETR